MNAQIKRRARAWLGRPYVWGHWDCSAFVSEVLGVERRTSHFWGARPAVSVAPGRVVWRSGHVGVLVRGRRGLYVLQMGLHGLRASFWNELERARWSKVVKGV